MIYNSYYICFSGQIMVSQTVTIIFEAIKMEEKCFWFTKSEQSQTTPKFLQQTYLKKD